MRVLASCAVFAVLCVVPIACGDDTSVVGGTGGTGTGTGNGCPPECFAPHICASSCGADDEFNNGCCACPDGTIDTASCPDTTITRGIWGEVTWLEGNQMPGPGSSPNSGQPLSREVRIYEAVSSADAVEATDRPEAYGVYDHIDATLVSSVMSDETGLYEVELEPGTYSVFAEDEGDWYCNGAGADGLCAVVVEDEPVQFDIRIDYAASY